ncbi:DUF3040 domain-containing protein [Streptomyces prasinopilosus]|uniref:DUF3040 domain-containing protein n=1 Tax=Streptomyces prasinopilosus TaxID=67344 RepID=A0A1G6ZGS6_9ACTN|nr:DUF3040 domain-containing protein [Streptomyces prasinopilosus]SDE01809.1 Protein of unknown function [Streptomyces prasinopilosus]
MTTSPLRDDEQYVLSEMERVLRRDRRFARRMRAPQRRRWSLWGRVARHRPRPWTVAVLLAVSAVLMVAGITTSEPTVIAVFAAFWPVTLYRVFRLLCRWTEP